MIYSLLILVACAPEAQKEKGGVYISFPKTGKFLQNLQSGKQTHFATSDTNSTDENEPKVIGDIDCYVVILTYDKEVGRCKNFDSGYEIVVSDSFGSILAGSAIELDVEAGPKRTFTVLGSSSPTGYCPDFRTITEADKDKISQPFVLGSKTVDIAAGTTVDLEITVSLNENSNSIHDCQGEHFSWEVVEEARFDEARFDEASFAP